MADTTSEFYLLKANFEFVGEFICLWDVYIFRLFLPLTYTCACCRARNACIARIIWKPAWKLNLGAFAKNLRSGDLFFNAANGAITSRGVVVRGPELQARSGN